MKKGILIVSFGTTYRETRKKTIKAVERDVAAAYPGIEVYHAFSSGMIRRRIEKQEGIHVPDVREALGQMKVSGITHVCIQPTYVITGIENDRLNRETAAWKQEFEQIQTGTPLLTDDADYEKVVEALWEEYGRAEEDRILLFIGHGTEHEAHKSYDKLEQAFHRQGHRNVFVATVEGENDQEDLLRRIRGQDGTNNTDQVFREARAREILLIPLMLVAGDHARHDIAGEDDSYLELFQSAGFEAEAILRGLGECRGIRDIYLSHLADEMMVK